MTTTKVQNNSILIGEILSSTQEYGAVDEGNPLWLTAIDRTQLSMCIVGAMVNILTVITLIKNGTGFQPCVSNIYGIPHYM